MLFFALADCLLINDKSYVDWVKNEMMILNNSHVYSIRIDSDRNSFRLNHFRVFESYR